MSQTGRFECSVHVLTSHASCLHKVCKLLYYQYFLNEITTVALSNGNIIFDGDCPVVEKQTYILNGKITVANDIDELPWQDKRVHYT